MADTHAYLHVTIQLVRGKSRLFYDTMAAMIPVLEENGWHLVGGFTPSIGRLNAVFHVWRVPSADGGRRSRWARVINRSRSRCRAGRDHDEAGADAREGGD